MTHAASIGWPARCEFLNARVLLVTYKHISKVHSLTVADVDGPTMTVRQLTADGDEVDRFVIKK